MKAAQDIMFQTQDLPIFSNTAPRAMDQAYIPAPAPPAQLRLDTMPGANNPSNEKVALHKIETLNKLPINVDFIEYRYSLERAIELFSARHGLPLEVFSMSDTRHFVR